MQIVVLNNKRQLTLLTFLRFAIYPHCNHYKFTTCLHLQQTSYWSNTVVPWPSLWWTSSSSPRWRLEQKCDRLHGTTLDRQPMIMPLVKFECTKPTSDSILFLQSMILTQAKFTNKLLHFSCYNSLRVNLVRYHYYRCFFIASRLYSFHVPVHLTKVSYLYYLVIAVNSWMTKKHTRKVRLTHQVIVWV